MNEASEAARALAKKRWAKTTKKQRLEIGKQLSEARAQKKKEKEHVSKNITI